MPETLKKRKDFLAANRGKRARRKAFVLQARDRGDAMPLRVGFTCSKKVGNAIMRNKAKRRLRSLARDVISLKGEAGIDYVLIGLAEATVRTPYADMVCQLESALNEVSK